MITQQIAKTPKSRWVGIDIFKGWGVWFMFLIHAFVQNICHFDASLFLPTIQRTSGWEKILLLIAGVPIGVLAIWGFMFGFAFACTVAMQMMNLIDTNPKKIPKYLFNKVISGSLLLLLNKIGHALFQINFFSDGSTIFPSLSVSYSADILDAVAWMGVLIPLTVLVFYGLFKIKKPIALVITFTILLTGWFAITPLFLDLGETSIVWLETRNLYFLKLVITKFTRGRFRLLPGLAYGFMGCIYATMLYHGWEFKKIFRFTLSFFAYCLAGCGIWWLFIEPNWIARFAEETVPIPLTIFSMSTMQFLLVLFLRNNDFAKDEKHRVKAARRTTFWRRYSLFSLTAFSINTGIAKQIFTLFVSLWGDSVDYSSTPGIIIWNAWQVMAFVLFMWGFWELLVRFWEKYNYKLSLDWILAQLMSWITGVKMGRSAVKPIIYGPNQYQIHEIISPVVRVKALN